VIVAGPGNTYGHYITTREEYGVQRYEGASTLFGSGKFYPRGFLIMFSDELPLATLEAYINRYSELVSYLADNATGSPSSDAAPPEQTSKAISLQVSLPAFDMVYRLLRVTSLLTELSDR